MTISLDHAIVIHARTLLARRGDRAMEAAMDHASTRKLSGDHEGYEIWRSVALQISRLADARRGDEAGSKKASP
jgi:hypothetical protein